MKRSLLARVSIAFLVLALLGQLPALAQDTVAPQPLPPIPNDDPWFGMVQSVSAPQTFVNAGARWSRLIFPWEDIQPTGPGDFQQGYFSEAEIEAQRALGIEVVGITLYTPRWAARDQRYGARSVPQNLQLPIDDPRNYWASYIKRLVAHYRGRIDTWVIYNEPDIYVEPDDFRTFAGTPADYAQLLKTAYLAAKSVNPNARIVMAGLTYFWDRENNRPQYLQRVLDAIRADPTAAANNWYFDVVDAHTYGNPLNSYTVPVLFQRIMRERGINKPIWIDESNVLIKNDPRVGSGDGPFRATMDEQASYMIQSMALARAAGVQRYSPYKLQDEHPESGDEYWGLTRNDGTFRPSYLGYQVAVRYMQHVRSATYYWGGTQTPPTEQEITTLLASNTGRFQWPWPAPVNAVVLDRGSERVTVIWNASPEQVQFALPARAASARLVTKYGQVSNVAAQGGAYQLTLEPSRNNSDPRDQTLYLVGGSPLIIVEDATPPTQTATTAPSPTAVPSPTPVPTSTPVPPPPVPAPEPWMLVFAPTPAYSLTDEVLWVAAPGEWYRVLIREGDWALALWEGDSPEWPVWIQLDERIALTPA
jgi:hypothetical protein